MPSLPSVLLRRRLLAGVVLVPVALALGGCAKSTTGPDPIMTSSIAKPMTPDDFQKAATYWGQRYDAKPKDRDAAINYAAALQRMGQADQAVVILSKAVLDFQGDRTVIAALGKAQAASGDLDSALMTIRRAEDASQPDWKLMSAEGAILDQMNRTDEARALYTKALALAPGDPTVLSNFGMSYVITGDLKQAEKLLRQAIAAPGADSRVRQNLALVVGLEGRFDEAQKIAAAEISPEQAAANVAYLKQMLAQQNSWQSLKGSKAPTT
jgi:Flp pilus assembly protein TadD